MSARVALITGADGGLGRAFAARLAREGRRLAVTDRAAPAGIAGAALSLAADLADPEAVAGLAAAVEAELGGCDILVNNAADLTRGTLAEVSLADWRRVQAVNVEAAFLLARALAPGMAARGFGRIVNVVSNTVWRPPGPGFTPYVASKGALLGFTRALAVELGPAGITVNALAPGLTRTPAAARDLPAAAFAQVREEQAVPRTLEPEDLTGALAFLTADDAGAVTGQALRVDGGVVPL